MGLIYLLNGVYPHSTEELLRQVTRNMNLPLPILRAELQPIYILRNSTPTRETSSELSLNTWAILAGGISTQAKEITRTKSIIMHKRFFLQQ
jgi:hypothetical protein